MDKLLEAYSGDRARGYDARRSQSKRWKAEVAAMARFLAELAPQTILDCPFGTGRWIEQFETIGAKVTGVDLSQGMLDEAAAKIAKLPAERQNAYSLDCKSIFDLMPAQGSEAPDLTVCIRFLNWVEFADAERALVRLSALGSPAMIVGASVVPTKVNLVRRVGYWLSLSLINLRAGSRPKQYVHPEADLLSAFARNGWRVVDRQEIMRRNARVNYFYRLERG
jgi:SAM-dependent methyltransferase